LRVEHFGEVGVVAALLRRDVTGTGDGVTLVRGGHGCLGGVHPLGPCGLVCRHGGFATFQIGFATGQIGLATGQDARAAGSWVSVPRG
jgi:hypothetical protein